MSSYSFLEVLLGISYVEFSGLFTADLVDNTRGPAFIIVGAFSVYFTVCVAVTGSIHVVE